MKKLIVAAALVALTVGCNNPGDEKQTATATPAASVEQSRAEARTDEDSDAQEDAQEEAQETDAEAIQKAYRDNLAEIKMAELAMEKSGDDKIRELATTIEQDHEKANQRLRALGSTLEVDLSDDLPDEKEEMHAKLSELSGEEFDQQYVEYQIALHEQAIEYYQVQGVTRQDSQLVTYFQQTVPALQDHLKTARETMEK